MSGSVPLDPGPLLYEVALYREAEEDGAEERSVGGAVPIGTRLQLRVSIDTSSVWRRVALEEVVLSPSHTDPAAAGSVTLVSAGCRVKEFAGIVPRQPWAPENTTGEVRRAARP